MANVQGTSRWLWWLLGLTVLLTIYMSLQEDVRDEGAMQTNFSAAKQSNTTLRNKPTLRPKRGPKEPMHQVDASLFDGLKAHEVDEVIEVGNAFEIRSWYVAPVKPKVVSAVAAAQAEIAQKPKAPPVPFVYVGKFDDKQIYLQNKDKLLLVEVGDVIAGKWRVEREDEVVLVLRYIPLDEETTLKKN